MITLGTIVEHVLGFLCAALAAFGNALANVMQRKASLEQAHPDGFGARQLLDLVRRPTWLVGFFGMVASFVLQAVALGLGQLSAIEPIITLEVPLTLLVASWVFHARIGRLEWTGIWAMTAGMIALVAALDPRPGNEETVSGPLYALAGGATVAAIVVLVGAGARGTSIRRTACLGAATGTAFGLTATLVKETLAAVSHRGVVGALTTWQPYTVVVSGLVGVVIMQAALQSGPLLAAQPGFTLMDPVVSIGWGVLVYHEQTRSGVALVPAILGGVAITAGVLLLVRSPLFTPDRGLVAAPH